MKKPANLPTVCLTLAVALLAMPFLVEAQEARPFASAPALDLPGSLFQPPPPAGDDQDRLGRMAFSGLLSGTIAMTIGWHVGRNLAQANEGGILVGGLLMSAAIPVGAFLGNDSRGELPLALVASYGIGFAGLLAVGSAWNDENVRRGALVIPLVQLGASIWVILRGMD